MHWYPEIMLRKYAGFSGRARRLEYWMFFLVYALLSAGITGAVLGLDWLVHVLTRGRWEESLTLEANLALGLLALVHLLPSAALTVRRLHDTNRSGWWALLALLPVVGALGLLYFALLPGDAQTNDHGPSPKSATKKR